MPKAQLIIWEAYRQVKVKGQNRQQADKVIHLQELTKGDKTKSQL